MKTTLFLFFILCSVAGYSQSITLSGTSFSGTGLCSATSANNSYSLYGDYNGKNQFAFGSTGQFGIACTFIIRWNSTNTYWELVSKEQTGPSDYKFTVLSTLSGDFPNPPCGAGFGGTITGSCSVNCNNTMTVSGGATICIGNSATLTASGCAGSVTWDNSGGSGTSITVSPTAITTYTATCSTAGVCTGSAVVVVNNPPAPQISIQGTGVTNESNNNYSVCAGASIQLYCGNCSSAEKTINWSNGTTSVNSSLSTAFIPVSSNSYNATQTILGCTGAVGNTVSLTVKSKMSVQATGTTLCKGSSTTLTATGCTGTVSWDNGAGSGTTVTVTPNFTTTYTATCSITSICGNSITINVTVPTPVAPSITATATTLCPGMTATLSGNGCTQGSFLWSTGATTPNIIVSTSNTYSLVCSSSLENCVSPQSSVTITSVQNDLALTGTAGNGKQQAAQTIVSSQIIPTNVNANYQAGKSILLNTSFIAQNGSIFKAEIQGCN